MSERKYLIVLATILIVLISNNIWQTLLSMLVIMIAAFLDTNKDDCNDRLT
jgi:hypothetical protein